MMTLLVLISLKLNLTVNLGNGYIYGTAYMGSKSYKINIQESLENKLILPNELQIESSQGSVLFETEKRKEVTVKCKIVDEPTDMILLYTDIQTLMNLTKDFPTTMNVSGVELTGDIKT
jgi:hypothetical protein